MGLFTFNRDIPDAPNNPSVDQPKMKVNTNSTDSLIAVDHYSFNVNTIGGYHKDIHIVKRTGNPASVANTGILYVKDYTPPGGSTDTQLFFKTALGGISQLTGNNAANNGYQWLGGVLIQWGQVTSTTSSPFQTLNFATNNIPFPNNCFAVYTQPYGTGTPPSSQATVEIRKSTVNKLSFQWVFVTNSGEYTGFYWVAIGN